MTAFTLRKLSLEELKTAVNLQTERPKPYEWLDVILKILKKIVATTATASA